ncbi:putative M08 family peptidase [Kitasatospora cheerisanensis KCTC 2395]|uniref:Putative M08 family peptidase n=2 Tax=Kitasatospora cheerisanensis TaxID=81942 RepID=A0A066YVH6_9ACTN|nr:putative M08 family peptidase [Kitasatospora cheerisanensis KCTC 2395]
MTLTKAMRVLGATTVAGALLFTAAPVASADQVRDGQWANSYFDLKKVWSVSKGDGVIVAVIDSGVDASHPDLEGSVLPGYDQSGQGLNTKPTDFHGTNMASLIAGHGHGDGEGVVGLAPGAKILPIYKKSADGSSETANGIRWAVDHNAKVVNISLGGSKAPKSDPELTKAVAYAAQHDVLIVASSGNSGLGTVDSPANEPGVLAVGATDKNDASWSKSDYGPEVLISAPGVQIVSAGGPPGSPYYIADGTSGSTAYVAAAAALVRAKFPKLTAGQVANRLIKSASVPAGLKGGKVPDPHYGYGILSPYDALTKDIPAGPAQGPLAAVAGTGSTSSPTAGGDSAGGAAPGDTLPTLPSASRDDASGTSAGVMIGVVGAGIAVLVIVIIVVVVARNRRRPAPMPVQPQQQPPYGTAPNWPSAQQQFGGQAPAPGYPPQYGNQAPPPGYPPQNPYQNPYGPDGGQSQR